MISHRRPARGVAQKQVAEQVLAREPQFKVSDFAAKQPYRDAAKRDALANALTSAGLPA